MRRRTKEILAGILSASILLGTPTCSEAAESWQKPAESTLEDFSETMSEEATESISKKISKEATESTSEEISEEATESLAEETSEEATENIPEETSEGTAESAPEETSEEATESLAEDDISEVFSKSLAEDTSESISKVVSKVISQKIIKLENSSDNNPLRDSDFYIELSRDGQVQRYSYDEWMDYLGNTNGWVRDQIEIKLSDTGKRYFSSIEMEYTTDGAKKKYTFWAENSERNISTKGAEDGTRSYTVGVDTEAPALKDFYTDSKCYEPTKTETEQYFAEDFILRGTFCDSVSGVSRVEYTADLHTEKDTHWVEAKIVQSDESQGEPDSVADFQITLPDGCYPAIAVRAYDQAGNVSEAVSFVNEADEPIRVVVDRTAPALRIAMTADGAPYSGEGDHWTNEDVRIAVTSDRDSRSYAGIYQCEYVYMKIGENRTDVSEQWTELPAQGESLEELVITEDKNGYYLFRAVSRSGVRTEKEVQRRILIQHQVAEIRQPLISGADETKCKNGWYNRQSGTPVVRFEYPEYDNGDVSKEYDAPIRIHYSVIRSSSEELEQTAERDEKCATIGVMSCADVTVQEDGSKQFALTKEDLGQHIVDFGYDSDTGEAQDGFYTLEYWITDQAGNESERQTYRYKIDCHAPTDLTMILDGSEIAVGDNSAIAYERFYRDTVSGSADAQYGISGKGAIKYRKAKKVGEWQGRESDSFEDADSIRIAPNIRCFLYIRAEDGAGNITEGWTNGIVVDNMAPNDSAGGNGKELIIEPDGANAHGFFNDDIAVNISVRDAPEDDNCAALQSVSGSVGRDGTDTITDRELFSFTKEFPTEDEITAASEFQCVQMIDAKANESNEAYIEVTAVDRSENAKTSTQMLKIDVTKPEIDISFDNNDAVNGSFYRQGRIATIHVHELNFDPGAVSVLVAKNGQPSDFSLSDWKSDGSEHYATLAFTEDGEYTVRANCIDLADNMSDEVQTEPFTIDCTAPEMTIELTAQGDAQTADKEYFHTSVTVAVTVTEHNFRPEEFCINMAPMSEKGTWIHDGDTHTMRILLDGDDVYHIDCAYVDMAGNPANAVEKDFVIDKIAPAIAIDGVVDGSANSGAILPVISVFDRNVVLSGISISVRTGIGDVVNTAIETEIIDGEYGVGFRLTLADMTEKPDNIYHLTVSVCDRAGNKSERVCRFSLNRKGSVYDLTSLVQLMENQYNTYDNLDDIQIVEMNIDTVEEFELYVSRNGTIGYEAEYTKKVNGSADNGYTYLYTINKENFAEEGIYRLSLYSRDRAGNEVNNVGDIHGNEILFVIDNTAPGVVIDGVQSGMVYDVEAQEVHVSVTDNFKLAEAEFTLVNGTNEVLKSWDYMQLAGEGRELNITIPQYNEEVSLLYSVKDAAGNEMQTFQGDRISPDKFLVTTDKFVQLINKPAKAPLGRMLIFVISLSVVVLLSITILIRKRKR